jgi:hypothetical protein
LFKLVSGYYLYHFDFGILTVCQHLLKLVPGDELQSGQVRASQHQEEGDDDGRQEQRRPG